MTVHDEIADGLVDSQIESIDVEGNRLRFVVAVEARHHTERFARDGGVLGYGGHSRRMRAGSGSADGRTGIRALG